MAFGEWMVPKPSLAAEAQLRHDIAMIRKVHPRDMARLVSLTESLLTQNMHYRTLVRQATCHIANIELQEILREPL
jgi:hypothetical protein